MYAAQYIYLEHSNVDELLFMAKQRFSIIYVCLNFTGCTSLAILNSLVKPLLLVTELNSINVPYFEVQQKSSVIKFVIVNKFHMVIYTVLNSIFC